MELVVQRSLLSLGSEVPAVRTPVALTRRQLDDWSWIDVGTGFLGGADHLFDDLVESIEWKGGERWMYDRVVAEPRLHGRLPNRAVLTEIRSLLAAHYGEPFDRGAAMLYRDGRDSVAWHGDRIRDRRRHSVVAIVTLGGARPFLVRPAGGGHSIRFVPGSGDLVVMGGAAQRDWEHTVPKVRMAGARVSVTFRSRSAVIDAGR